MKDTHLVALKHTKIMQNKSKAIIRRYHQRSEMKVISDANVHLFFRYVNSKLKNKSFVAPLKNKNNNLLTKDTEKASFLNEYFTSIFTKDNGTNPVFGQNFDENSVLSNIIFSTLSEKML